MHFISFNLNRRWEAARIQRDVRDGNATFATDEQMAALWKSCGL
jgi:hypothetical protein